MDTYSQIMSDFKEGKNEKITLEAIENAQMKSGFFDENLIWADFEKI
jgi:hypothetical protein